MNEANLVDRVARFIERFVFVRDKQIYILLALWVLATHLCAEFDYIGYVFLHSTQPQSGKSRLLEVFDLLVANSSGLLIQPTESILFRTAPNSTQLMDEVDTWTNREYLRGILNAGFQRGGTVKRNAQQTDGSWKPETFSVFGPRALAGIGLHILDRTTRDRSFAIAMWRQTGEERCEKFRWRRVKPEADLLKADIEAWVKQNRERVRSLYDDAEKTLWYLSHLGDRTQDIVEPLAAILEAAWEGAPELGERRSELLEAVGGTRKDGGEFLADRRIVRELLRLATITDPLVGSPSELATLCELDPKPTGYELSAVLRAHGFESRSTRAGESVRYRYSLTRKQLEAISVVFDFEPQSAVTNEAPSEPG